MSLRGLLRHVRPLGEGQVLSAQVDFSFQDEVFKESVNRAYLAADSYWLWNARLAWTAKSGLELALWGRNLADETYVVEALDSGVGFSGRIFNEPRTFGLSASLHVN